VAAGLCLAKRGEAPSPHGPPSNKLDKGIRNVRPSIIGNASRRPLHVLHQPIQIIAGVRYADYTNRRLIPQWAGLKFRNGDIERAPKTVFQTPSNLPLVLKGVRAFDAELEGKKGNHQRGIR
jgi:hypothetical protein